MSSGEWDVRVDRATEWGNPYSHKNGTQALYKVKSRKEAIAKYREYILTRTDLMKRLPELKDKRLGCWCVPKPCHADVLAELADRKINLESF